MASSFPDPKAPPSYSHPADATEMGRCLWQGVARAAFAGQTGLAQRMLQLVKDHRAGKEVAL